MVDEAIKAAYKFKGVAVVTIPVDYGFAEIDEQEIATAKIIRQVFSSLMKRIYRLPFLILNKQKPVLYIGQGLFGHFDAIDAFSKHFSMPIAASVLAKGIVPDLYENFLGFAGRVATKPANEALAEADLIVLSAVTSLWPPLFNPGANFVQVDIDASKFGRRHQTDVSVLGDGATALRKWTEMAAPRPADAWLCQSRKLSQLA